MLLDLSFWKYEDSVNYQLQDIYVNLHCLWQWLVWNETVSQVFTTGVKEITTEPAFYNNVVEFNGSYYKVGGK